MGCGAVGLSGGSGLGGARPVSERRRVPAGTRCSRGAARSCGSSVPTSSCWRCGPACPSPRTPCSSASPWSECGHGSGAGGLRGGGPSAGAGKGLLHQADLAEGGEGTGLRTSFSWLLSPSVSEAQPSKGRAWEEGSAYEMIQSKQRGIQLFVRTLSAWPVCWHSLEAVRLWQVLVTSAAPAQNKGVSGWAVRKPAEHRICLAF